MHDVDYVRAPEGERSFRLNHAQSGVGESNATPSLGPEDEELMNILTQALEQGPSISSQHRRM